MNMYEKVAALSREGHRAALATITNVRGSVPSFATAKMLVSEDGTIYGTIGGGCVEAEVWQAAREVIEEERPRKLAFDLNQKPQYDTGLVCGGSMEVFIEPIIPPPPLYIFGAGHVGQQVYKVAHLAGFEVTVWDDRETYSSRERYPEAREVIACDLDDAASKLTISSSSYVVIVTRGHRNDMQVLRWAVDTPAQYVGMIGSKRKVLTVYQNLEAEGLDPQKFERVHAPIGLNIGATSPEEIAVSVVAEMIAVRRHASATLSHSRELHKNQERREVNDVAGK